VLRFTPAICLNTENSKSENLTNKNPISIYSNSYNVHWDDYALETCPDIKPYQKSPTRGDYTLWNDETEKLSNCLTDKKGEAEKYWDTFSQSFHNNLFVNMKFADEYIYNNIKNIIGQIDKLVLSVGELRSNYHKIYKDDGK
jgi:ABC-type phosphate transport system substrate-binding protein